MSVRNCKNRPVIKAFNGNLQFLITHIKTVLLNKLIERFLKRCRQCFSLLILRSLYGHLRISGQSNSKTRLQSLAFPDITLVQAVYGEIRDRRYLRVFGCTAYMHILQEKRIKIAKPETQSQRCQMVGYDENGIYKV